MNSYIEKYFSWFMVYGLLFLLTACGGSSSSVAPVSPTPAPTPTAVSCDADVAVTAGLFTMAPMDIADVTEVEPLGNVAPASHVQAVDHMYVHHPIGAGDGSAVYPVYAMASGDVYMIERRVIAGRVDDDYDVYIKNTCSVSSYYFHLEELGTLINGHIASTGSTWIDVFGNGTTFMMLLGQPGAAPMLRLNAGEVVGANNNFDDGFDIGVIDKRSTNGTFLNTSDRRYPWNEDYFPLVPAVSSIDFSIYQLGNKSINSACFLDYMDDSANMKTDWTNLLVSTPKVCGKNGWDVANMLRGHWYNPAVDALAAAPFDIEVAVFTLVPYNRDPDNQVIIGFGNADQGMTVPSLALLDPINFTPPIAGMTQIKFGSQVLMDKTANVTVNPDPSQVGVGVTVCYDMPTPASGMNYILLHMDDATTVRIKYDPTNNGVTSQCPILEAGGYPAVDTSWVTYIR